MRSLTLYTLLVALFILCAPDSDAGQLRLRKKPIGGDLSSKPLFQQADWPATDGGFRLPINAGMGIGMARGMAFHEGGSGLFLSTHEQGSGTKVIEVSIPGTLGNTLGAMVRAEVVQAATDITEGNMAEITANDPGGLSLTQYRHYAMLVYNGRLCNAAYIFYDGNSMSDRSHYCHARNLATASFAGWDAVWNQSRARSAAGPMALVPDYAVTALGGPVLATRPGEISVQANISQGYSAFAFDPDQISGRTVNLIAAEKLMYYDYALGEALVPTHNTPGASTDIWNYTTENGGCVIPYGYRSLLCTVRHGYGPYCYGTGVADDPPTPPACYDPVFSSSGDHAYPYRYQFVAFDLQHFAEVKAGTRLANTVAPYAWWVLTFPIAEGPLHQLHAPSMAYDRANNRVYVSQYRMDSDESIIWRYTLPTP